MVDLQTAVGGGSHAWTLSGKGLKRKTTILAVSGSELKTYQEGENIVTEHQKDRNREND